MPQISVILSVYNSQDFLREAIESILNQTFTDFEFIIINDASTDDSKVIILSYSDSRIIYLENETNIGLTKSLNKALKIAKGKYIARIDADDISFNTRFEKQIKFFEKNPDYELLGTWVQYISDKGELWGKKTYPARHTYFLLNFFNCLIHSTAMFTKQAYIEAGGYDENIRFGQDFDLWLKIAKKHRVTQLEEILGYYRFSENHITAKRGDEQMQLALNLVRKNLKYHNYNQNIPDDFLKCYMQLHKTLKSWSIFKIISCINTLKSIKNKILKTDNININKNNIESAYKAEVHKIFDAITLYYPVYKKLLLLLFTRSFFRIINR